MSKSRIGDNVGDNRAAGDIVFVGADKIAKLSAETSRDRAPAASCSSHCYPTWLAIPKLVRAVISRNADYGE